jgi:hypothetical protein
MLRVNFHVGKGDTPTLMLASCLRFCADGTLRGPDNYVVARCVDGLWQVGGRMHRELDCEGPVRVRITPHASDSPVHRGPFRRVHTVNGVLHGDDVSLHVTMPGRVGDNASPCNDLTLLSPSSR